LIVLLSVVEVRTQTAVTSIELEGWVVMKKPLRVAVRGVARQFLFLVALTLLAFAPQRGMAEDITLQLRARVGPVITDPYNVLGGAVHPGDEAVAFFKYSTSPDEQNANTFMSLSNWYPSASGYGFTAYVGEGLVFEPYQDPRGLSASVNVFNNFGSSAVDELYYWGAVQPLSGTYTAIDCTLVDHTSLVLSDTQLPLAAPTLTDWDYKEMTLVEYNSSGNSIYYIPLEVYEITLYQPPPPPPLSHGTAALTFTGADQPFIVPTGVTELVVDMWGAGGEFATADLGGLDCEYMPGGGGGYVNGRIPVTPGEVLTVRVGGNPPNLTGAGWPNGGVGWLDQVVMGGRTYYFGLYGGAGGSSSILRGNTVLAEAGGGNGGLPCMAPLGGGYEYTCTPFGNQRGTDLATGYEAGGGGWCGGASSRPSASGLAATATKLSINPANGETPGGVTHAARQGAGQGGWLNSATPGRVYISWGTTDCVPNLVASPRFVDNGETVSDLQMCLMWEKKTGTFPGTAEYGDPHNVNNFYTYGTQNNTAKDGTVFTDFLAKLNAGTGFAGYTDWRLPNEFNENPGITGLWTTAVIGDPLREMESILPLPSVFGPNASGIAGVVDSAYYWSATPGTVPNWAWHFSWSAGIVSQQGVNVPQRARAVRNL